MPTYIVFGAAKLGIGQAIFRRLCNDGANVIGTYAEDQSDAAAELKREFPDVNLQLIDHSSVSSLTAFAESLPAQIDGAVIAHMYFDIRDAFDFTPAEWNMSLAVNITLPHFAALKIGPKITSGGSLVTVTSTEGFVGSFGAAGYAASKAAVHNLIKTHANILGPINVRVNAIAAGWIGGVMDTDEVFNMSRRITPLGRLGTPEEIAGVTSFLLGPDASFVTGATIVADGGYTCVDAIAKYEYEAMQKS